jgi:hypothetical protein
MKVTSIISESMILENNVSFDDLSPLQVGALKAINDGRLDFENASDRMIDVLYDLQDFGLLDKEFELTTNGLQAVEIAQTHGSYDKRKAQKRAQMQPDVDLDFEDEDDFREDLSDWSEYEMNRYGTPNDNLPA